MKFCEKYQDTSYIETDDRRSVVRVEDRGGGPCVWKGLNNARSRVIKYRVDGGIISSNSEIKCDCAVYVEDDSVYLIELKGTDYGHALEQIEATLDRLIVSPSVETSSVNGRIVLTKGRTPKLRYSRETSLVKKFIRLNGTLRSGARVLEEKISG